MLPTYLYIRTVTGTLNRFQYWVVAQYLGRLGLVTPDLVPSLLDAIMDHSRTTPPLRGHWRGRMGLDKDQQLELYDRTTTQP